MQSSRTDTVALVSLVCGVGPLVLGLLSLPIVLFIGGGVITLVIGGLGLLGAPSAIGFGIAGVLRATREKRSAAVAGFGLAAGIVWVLLTGGLALVLFALDGGRWLAGH